MSEQEIKQKHPGGRPTIFTEEVAKEICDRLANGESLRKICRDEHTPSQPTIFTWLDKDKEFLKQYARARRKQAEAYADETVQIADDLYEKAEHRPMLGEDLRAEADVAKLRIHARQWHASKLRPKKYGDKLQSTVKSEGKLEITDSNDVKDKLFDKLSNKAVVATEETN